MTDPVEKWLEAGARAAFDASQLAMAIDSNWDNCAHDFKDAWIASYRVFARAFLAEAEKDGYALVKVPEPFRGSENVSAESRGHNACRDLMLASKVEIAP